MSRPRELGRSVGRPFAVLADEFNRVRFRLPFALGISNKLPPLSMGRVRIRVLRLGGLQIGEGTTIGGRLWIAGGPTPVRSFRAGDFCFVNDGCRLDTSAPITLGDNVHIGHDVRIITSTHEIGSAVRRAGWASSEPVDIGSGAWIGAGSTILPGVRIGAGSIVAAGAVVTKSVADNTLVGGVPARYIRDLDLAYGGARPAAHDADRPAVRLLSASEGGGHQ
ncbi:MAG: DapH/DapD/GlmU-related protein [Ilumatobacteraceae bacterium]